MHIPSDMLPNQWQVVLKDGSVIGVWAGMYGEQDGYYTFDVLAEASTEEQSDENLVITDDNPSRPERIICTVARIPMDLVANIYSRRWDTQIQPSDLVPTEWAPRPHGESGQ